MLYIISIYYFLLSPVAAVVILDPFICPSLPCAQGGRLLCRLYLRTRLGKDSSPFRGVRALLLSTLSFLLLFDCSTGPVLMSFFKCNQAWLSTNSKLSLCCPADFDIRITVLIISTFVLLRTGVD